MLDFLIEKFKKLLKISFYEVEYNADFLRHFYKERELYVIIKEMENGFNIVKELERRMLFLYTCRKVNQKDVISLADDIRRFFEELN